MRRPALGLARSSAIAAALTFASLPFAPVRASSQAPAATTPGDPRIDAIVASYHTAADSYRTAFRNLVAEEAKTIEIYDDSGELERRRHIVSDLLVYASPRDHSAATEYRDVISVDGRIIDTRRARALRLLADATSASSVGEELEVIDRETRRYEFRRHLRGGTINQSGIPRQWRESFVVEHVAHERIAGIDTLVLAYRQVRRSSAAGAGLRLPREFVNTPVLAQGTLWLDAETYQLRRSIWELTVRHRAVAEPLVVIRSESTYAPSRFGILAPDRIVFEWRERFSQPKSGPPAFALTERVTSTYGSFRRFAVTTNETIDENR